jgi:hypothetical protein
MAMDDEAKQLIRDLRGLAERYVVNSERTSERYEAWSKKHDTKSSGGFRRENATANGETAFS